MWKSKILMNKYPVRNDDNLSIPLTNFDDKKILMTSAY